MSTQTINFKTESISKGELAEKLYSDENIVFDCAIPQSFVDDIGSRFSDLQLQEFGNIASHFVMVYDCDIGLDYIAPLTKTGVIINSILATYQRTI